MNFNLLLIILFSYHLAAEHPVQAPPSDMHPPDTEMDSICARWVRDAHAMVQKSNYAKAVYFYNQALKYCDQPSYYEQRGDLYFQLKQYDSAAMDFSSVLLRQGDSPNILLKRANSWFRAKHFQSAADDFATIYNQYPTQLNDTILLSYARSLKFSHKKEKAIGIYFECWKSNRASLLPLLEQIDLLLSMQYYKEALYSISIGMQQDENNERFYLQRAKLQTAYGRDILAKEDIQKALAINSKMAEAWKISGLNALYQKDTIKACRDFKQAQALGWPDIDAIIQKYCPK